MYLGSGMSRSGCGHRFQARLTSGNKNSEILPKKKQQSEIICAWESGTDPLLSSSLEAFSRRSASVAEWSCSPLRESFWVSPLNSSVSGASDAERRQTEQSGGDISFPPASECVEEAECGQRGRSGTSAPRPAVADGGVDQGAGRPGPVPLAALLGEPGARQRAQTPGVRLRPLQAPAAAALTLGFSRTMTHNYRAQSQHRSADVGLRDQNQTVAAAAATARLSGCTGGGSDRLEKKINLICVCRTTTTAFTRHFPTCSDRSWLIELTDRPQVAKML